MTQQDVFQTIAKEAGVSESQAGSLIEAFFSSIARELSVGEPVEVDGLGKFFTVKYQPANQAPTQGEIALPEVQPDFEPDTDLVKMIQEQVKNHPELFVNPPDQDEEDDSGSKSQEVDGSIQTEEVASTPITASVIMPILMPPLVEEPLPEPVLVEEKPVIKEVSKVGQTMASGKPLGRASTIQFLDISHLTVEKDVLALISQSTAKQYGLVPIALKEGVLSVAMVDPDDFDALQVVRRQTGLVINPILSTKEDITLVLDQYTGLQAELQEVFDKTDMGISAKELEEASQEDLQDQTNEHAPTAKIVYSLLKRAVKEKASDVHIEPYEGKVVVRIRIDGVLIPRVELPKEIQSAVIARLKILANLKIDEQRLPQDGRFSLIFDHRQVDFRLSTIPVVYGEKVVMRILDKTVGMLTIEEVGLSDRGLVVLNNNARRSHGMILVTGPTGSGKTTSLYAVLGKMMAPSVNILTLEDPVEYRIESINQSQVHAEIGYGFAAGLRAAVRQDPDIVMLGEIRDQETADMAVHAALTGHIVLSTLHTNDAAGAFPRLIDMHIEPFLITSSVHTVIGQRLARKICPECREKVEISKAELEEIKVEVAKMPEEAQAEMKKENFEFFKGKGCDACGGKGYKGRIGVFEVLDVTEPIRELVLLRSSGSVITQQAVKEGMVTMVQDGIIKASRGLTTMEEVWRVTRE